MDGWQLMSAQKGEKLLYCPSDSFDIRSLEIVYFVETVTAVASYSSKTTDFSRVFVKVTRDRTKALNSITNNATSREYFNVQANRIAPCSVKTFNRFNQLKIQMDQFRDSFRDAAEGRKRPVGDRSEPQPLSLTIPEVRYDLFLHKGRPADKTGKATQTEREVEDNGEQSESARGITLVARLPDIGGFANVASEWNDERRAEERRSRQEYENERNRREQKAKKDRLYDEQQREYRRGVVAAAGELTNIPLSEIKAGEQSQLYEAANKLAAATGRGINEVAADINAALFAPSDYSGRF